MTKIQYQTSNQDIDPVMLQAIEWMVLLESGLETDQERHNFQIWFNSNILHQQAWQALKDGVDQPFQQLKQESLNANLPVKVATKTVLTVNKLHIKRMVKGGTSLILLIGFGIFIWLQQTRPLSFLQADYYTKIAEQKTIQLADGSMITLAAYSAIKVDYSKSHRDIYLLDGSLVADVKADKARPFTVHTQHAQMQALGTEFMVQEHTDYSELAVLEHTVKVSNIKESKVIEQGQSVRVDQDKIKYLQINATVLASWKDGILQVQDMPLSALIKLIKPYHQGSIYLSDDVKNIKVYGVFFLNDTDKVLENLQLSLPLKVIKLKLGLVYISKLDKKQ
jgi:transmembrane sensor